MAKKINHKKRGGCRELLFSLCPLYSLCSLWFFDLIPEDNKKSHTRGDLIETSHKIHGLIAKNEKDFEGDVSDSIREICRKFTVASSGTVAFSSEIAMPLDSTAEYAEPHRGLKTISKLCALRGDKPLDFQTVSHHPNCRIRVMWRGATVSKGTSMLFAKISRKCRTGFDALSGL